LNYELKENLPFKKEDVDIENITASLIMLCSVNEIISQEKQYEIKRELDELFIENAEQFTKRESSTLPVKQAEKLYQSLLYQADVFLLSLSNIKKAVKALSNMSIKSIVNNGKELILKYYEETRLIFKKVFATRLSIPIYEYQYVINKSFDEYYVNYDARFDAQNHSASIDYPLLYGNWFKTKGVLYIKEYYTSILLENEFCRLFDEKDILWLLNCVGRNYDCDYKDLLFNIAEVVLINMLASSMVNKSNFKLKLSKDDREEFYKKYNVLSKEDVKKAVKKSFFPYYKLIKNPQLVQYIRKYIPIFATDLYVHLSNNNLEKYICFVNK